MGYGIIMYDGWQDHPRIRGTNSDFDKVSGKVVGSSPHTRDKYIMSEEAYNKYRIIPAYAGQMVDLIIFRIDV